MKKDLKQVDVREKLPFEEWDVRPGDFVAWSDNCFKVRRIIEETRVLINDIVYKIVDFVDEEGVFRCWNQYRNGGTIVKGEDLNGAL